MSKVDLIILIIDFDLYLAWILCVILWHNDWDGVLGYKKEEEKRKIKGNHNE
jgi:hypothetical protein